MGSAAAVDHPHESTHTKSLSSSSSFRRRSHQSSTSTVMTESGDTSTTASVVTVSPPSTPATNNQLPSCDPSPTMSPWTRASSVSLRPQPTRSSSSIQIAGSAPSSSSIMMAQRANQSSMKLEDLLDPARHSEDDTASTQTAPTSSSTTTSVPVRSRTAVSTRSTRSGRYNSPPTSASVRAPLSSTTSAVDRRLIDKYERLNEEIERVIRATNADVLATGENGELLKQVRSELRKAKKNSTQIIQSQKELLEKMERQERGGLRRMFSMNREHKMEKLRNKLCEKLNQSVAADEQLDRLERQSVSLTRMSFGSLCGSNSGFGLPLEHDELYELERERDDIVANLISSAGLVDAQELHTRLALFSSEKRACECAMKQVDQCETLYRKALHLLRVALSTILAPTYSGSLKEFVLGPYPLAVEASQLVEQACRAIQPESRRRYSAYTPELSNVRPPKFPQQMVDFAKRGARSNFDPSNSAAIEAMRKLHLSENVVILLQRIVIAKLELIDKWKRDVERDLASAEEGYRKMETRLQAHVARLARSVSAA